MPSQRMCGRSKNIARQQPLLKQKGSQLAHVHTTEGKEPRQALRKRQGMLLSGQARHSQPTAATCVQHDSKQPCSTDSNGKGSRAICETTEEQASARQHP